MKNIDNMVGELNNYKEYYNEHKNISVPNSINHVLDTYNERKKQHNNKKERYNEIYYVC